MQGRMRKIMAVEMAEGAGARVKRLFPTQHLKHVDPFVLLDEFFVGSSAGFPSHPHRGFEAITYMLEGSFRHKDNVGNDRQVSQGGVQRFTAGRGIVHSEMPGEAELNHGIQLWVNLPKRLKKIEPSYEQVDPPQIPESTRNGQVVRTIVGDRSPIDLHTDILYLDIRVEAESSYIFAIPPRFAGLIYVYEGELQTSETGLQAGEGLLLEAEEELSIHSQSPSRFLALAGKPHGEPIHLHGSFVD